jgi:hypothetical protein
MNMAEAEPSFHVSYPETVQNSVKELAERAVEQGYGERVATALRYIDARLKQDPRSFVEPKFRYKDLQLVMHVAVHPPLVVHFTVHETLPVVFVKSLHPLPGVGL